MNTRKRTVMGVLTVVIVSGLLSFMISRNTSVAVSKGFSFGPPTAQAVSPGRGIYKTTYYGFPSTYQIKQTFTPTDGLKYTSSYDLQPFDVSYIVSNFIFWTAIFTAILAPASLIYRHNKMQSAGKVLPEAAMTNEPNEVKLTEEKQSSQVK